jgi:RND family efflux transporter MFP subunit
VRTVTIQAPAAAANVTFSGQIEAMDQVPLSFRISGRLAERPINVGDRVRDGQVVARLEPDNELNELRAAQAALSIAESQLRQAENHFRRQSRLYELGHSPRYNFELAEQAQLAAQAQTDSARAHARIAEEVVGFTTLEADAPGVVTAVGAEPGEIVAAGRMIVNLARRGGRDGVFDVPEDVVRAISIDTPVVVSLSASPETTVHGLVREIAPEADRVTRTFRVRIGLTSPPESFRLGAAVAARVSNEAGKVLSVPSSAVTRIGQDSVVWVVDPKTQKVSPRRLEVADATPATTYVANGLATGDIVVSAGAGSLREGQLVRLTGTEPR